MNRFPLSEAAKLEPRAAAAREPREVTSPARKPEKPAGKRVRRLFGALIARLRSAFVLRVEIAGDGTPVRVRLSKHASGRAGSGRESELLVYEFRRQADADLLKLKPRYFAATALFGEDGTLRKVNLDDRGELTELEEHYRTAPPADDGAIRDLRSLRKVFELQNTPHGASFQVKNVPYYYISGIHKKLRVEDSWNEPFGSIANKVVFSERTLLLHDRLYTLWQAMRNTAHLPMPTVEVGVFRGGSTRFLAEVQRHFGKRAPIYACDTFEGHPHVDLAWDPHHKVGTFGNGLVDFSDVQEYLAPYPEIKIVRGDILKTAGSISESQIALLHVDVDVYQATRHCLETFGPRVAAAGLIIVDDYGFTTCPGAKKAVDEFVDGRKDFAVMHLLTGQAVLHRISMEHDR